MLITCFPHITDCSIESGKDHTSAAFLRVRIRALASGLVDGSQDRVDNLVEIKDIDQPLSDDVSLRGVADLEICTNMRRQNLMKEMSAMSARVCLTIDWRSNRQSFL